MEDGTGISPEMAAQYRARLLRGVDKEIHLAPAATFQVSLGNPAKGGYILEVGTPTQLGIPATSDIPTLIINRELLRTSHGREGFAALRADRVVVVIGRPEEGEITENSERASEGLKEAIGKMPKVPAELLRSQFKKAKRFTDLPLNTSRIHAAFSLENGDYVVRDLNSTNGTVVNYRQDALRPTPIKT